AVVHLAGRSGLHAVGQGLPRLPPRKRVAARVDHEPVQPRCELRLAAELPDSGADLRERVLRSVARLLRITEDPPGQLLDGRLVAHAQRLKGLSVAVLR